MPTLKLEVARAFVIRHPTAAGAQLIESRSRQRTADQRYRVLRGLHLAAAGVSSWRLEPCVMSEVIGRLSRHDLQHSIEKSRFGLAVENRLLQKRREAHRRLNERIRLIDEVEDALRQLRSTRDDRLR